jgi:predicted phosphodiesterase
MKLALLSDGHGSSKTPYWRTDYYKVTFLDKLEYVLDYSKKSGVNALLWAGDICDTTRDWYLLPDLTELIKKYEVPIIAVYGQHDLYMRSEVNKHSTNLGVLVKAGLVRIAGQDPIVIGNTKVVGASYGQSWPLLPKESGIHNILIVHAPIYLMNRQSEFPKTKILDASAVGNKYKNYNLILCGDIHRRFVVQIGNRYVVNTGPLMRNKSDEAMQHHQPSFYIWNSSVVELSRKPIPHKVFKQIADETRLEHKDETKLLKEFSDVLEMESARMTNTNHISIFKTFTKLLKSSPELKSSAAQILTSMLEDLKDE